MQLTQKLLLNIPSPLLGILIIGSAVFLSIVGLVIVRRYIPHHKQKVHNDVAGAIFNIMGLAYTVLLAFVVVIVWENFDRAKANVEKEADCLSDIYKDSECFSQEFKNALDPLISEYVDAVINDEWKSLERGEGSRRVQDIMKKIVFLYSNYSPRTVTEQIFFEESVRKLNNLSEFRRQRIMDSRQGVHPLLWFVLLVGGSLIICFTFFFGSENLGAHILMASLLAAIISLILLTILFFDFPFTGDVNISPKAFKEVFIY